MARWVVLVQNNLRTLFGWVPCHQCDNLCTVTQEPFALELMSCCFRHRLFIFDGSIAPIHSVDRSFWMDGLLHLHERTIRSCRCDVAATEGPFVLSGGLEKDY